MRASDIAAGGWGLVLGRRGLLGLRLTACLFLLFGLGLRVRLGFGLFVRLAFALSSRARTLSIRSAVASSDNDSACPMALSRSDRAFLT